MRDVGGFVSSTGAWSRSTICSRVAFACVVLAFAAIAACGRSSKTVTTSQGTFTVPGPARVAGSPGGIGFAPVATTGGTCESPSLGLPVQLERSRVADGRTSFYVAQMYGCGSGWVDERWIVPAAATAAAPAASR